MGEPTRIVSSRHSGEEVKELIRKLSWWDYRIFDIRAKVTIST